MMIERVVFHFDNISAIFAVCGLLKLNTVAPYNDWIACINSLHSGHGFVEKNSALFYEFTKFALNNFFYTMDFLVKMKTIPRKVNLQ